LEKSPGYSRKIPQTLKFAVVTRNKFSRADPQKSLASGKNRPYIAVVRPARAKVRFWEVEQPFVRKPVWLARDLEMEIGLPV